MGKPGLGHTIIYLRLKRKSDESLHIYDILRHFFRANLYQIAARASGQNFNFS